MTLPPVSQPTAPDPVVIDPVWFGSWNAPNTAINHPDPYRVLPRRQPSRDVAPADRPGYRAGYARVVFATGDPDTPPGGEPEDTLLTRAVMTLRRRTQPVVTLAPVVDPDHPDRAVPATDHELIDGHPQPLTGESAFLNRCAASPWVSDEALSVLHELHQDLLTEQFALARLEAEQTALTYPAPTGDGTTASDRARQIRLTELEPLLEEARTDLRYVTGAFQRLAQQVTEQVATARDRLVDPTGHQFPGLAGPDTIWSPITDAERAALLDYARLYPLAKEYVAAHHTFEEKLAAVRAVSDNDPDTPGFDPTRHRRAVGDADTDLLDARRHLDRAEDAITTVGGDVDPFEGDPHRAVFTGAGQRIVIPLGVDGDAALHPTPPGSDAAGTALQRAQRLSHDSVHQRSASPSPTVTR